MRRVSKEVLQVALAASLVAPLIAGCDGTSNSALEQEALKQLNNQDRSSNLVGLPRFDAVVPSTLPLNVESAIAQADINTLHQFTNQANYPASVINLQTMMEGCDDEIFSDRRVHYYSSAAQSKILGELNLTSLQNSDYRLVMYTKVGGSVNDPSIYHQLRFIGPESTNLVNHLADSSQAFVRNLQAHSEIGNRVQGAIPYGSAVFDAVTGPDDFMIIESTGAAGSHLQPVRYLSDMDVVLVLNERGKFINRVLGGNPPQVQEFVRMLPHDLKQQVASGQVDLLITENQSYLNLGSQPFSGDSRLHLISHRHVREAALADLGPEFNHNVKIDCDSTVAVKVINRATGEVREVVIHNDGDEQVVVNTVLEEPRFSKLGKAVNIVMLVAGTLYSGYNIADIMGATGDVYLSFEQFDPDMKPALETGFSCEGLQIEGQASVLERKTLRSMLAASEWSTDRADFLANNNLTSNPSQLKLAAHWGERVDINLDGSVEVQDNGELSYRFPRALVFEANNEEGITSVAVEDEVITDAQIKEIVNEPNYNSEQLKSEIRNASSFEELNAIFQNPNLFVILGRLGRVTYLNEGEYSDNYMLVAIPDLNEKGEPVLTIMTVTLRQTNVEIDGQNCDSVRVPLAIEISTENDPEGTVAVYAQMP